MKLSKIIKKSLIDYLGILPYPFNDKGRRRNSYSWGFSNTFAWIVICLFLFAMITLLFI